MLQSVASASAAPALLALSGTIAAAILGIAGKYVYDLRIARRKDRLERINAQLKFLYGPLYATDLAAHAVWRAFWQKLDPLDPRPKSKERHLSEWKLWVENVFMPLNERMEKTIIENADLVAADALPDGLLDLCAHVASYKVILQKWRDGDFSEHSPLIDYPADKFRRHVQTTFKRLKAEQSALLDERAQ